jgi:hypothetical protein
MPSQTRIGNRLRRRQWVAAIRNAHSARARPDCGALACGRAVRPAPHARPFPDVHAARPEDLQHD